MESRVAELESEVRFLRQEIVRLSGEVVLLRRSSAELSERQSSAASVLDSPLRAPGSSSSYTLLTEPAANSIQTGLVQTGVAQTVPQTWAERERICEGIGAWLARGLVGDHRGASGRDQLRLSSRVWIVARDYSGVESNPVLVFNAFHKCKGFVKRGEDCGQSLFVGLPSQREAKIVVARAGLDWPDSA